MTCLICGDTSKDVSVGLVEWRKPIDGRRFDALPRCQDRKACQERVAAIGDEWPVVAERSAA